MKLSLRLTADGVYSIDRNFIASIVCIGGSDALALSYWWDLSEF